MLGAILGVRGIVLGLEERQQIRGLDSAILALDDGMRGFTDDRLGLTRTYLIGALGGSVTLTTTFGFVDCPPMKSGQFLWRKVTHATLAGVLSLSLSCGL